ncbi:MAG: GIY-YIG nuclease family protein [Candidatus Omnitrophica bacterium]|nr:GIY-YIG nuclease family protein [Candidatus Omnitrophota bacterium]
MKTNVGIGEVDNFMPAHVYILESERNGKYYVGSTTNINERVRKHNAGEVYSTKRLMPLKLVFKTEFLDIKIARSIEYKLKRLKRKDYLQKIVNSGVITLKNMNKAPEALFKN